MPAIKQPPADRDLATMLGAMGGAEAVAKIYSVEITTLRKWKKAAEARDPAWLETSTTGSIAAGHIRDRQNRNAKELAKLVATIPLAASRKVVEYLQLAIIDPKDVHAQAVFAAQYVPASVGVGSTTEATISALHVKLRQATAPVALGQ